MATGQLTGRTPQKVSFGAPYVQESDELVFPPRGKYAYGFGDITENGVRCVGHGSGAPGMNGSSRSAIPVTRSRCCRTSTLAVGAFQEPGAATGINGNQASNSAFLSGAVYVFTRSGATWSQQTYVKASNTGMGDAFGFSVALSSDGSTLAVGAHNESSAATDVNGNQADNSAANAGAVYVFTRGGTTWSQEAYIKASNTNAHDLFGESVALSSDGSTLAVGAVLESSAAKGIGGNQFDNSASLAGAVYEFTRSGGTWSQQGYVKASNTHASDLFGTSVALSNDGLTLVVGASWESSAATGIGGTRPTIPLQLPALST